jgi:hypothetical protein
VIYLSFRPLQPCAHHHRQLQYRGDNTNPNGMLAELHAANSDFQQRRLGSPPALPAIS